MFASKTPYDVHNAQMSMNTNIFSAISNSKRKNLTFFSFRITYCTKNIGIHTHLCIMSIVKFTRGKQHISNELIGSTFS